MEGRSFWRRTGPPCSFHGTVSKDNERDSSESAGLQSGLNADLLHPLLFLFPPPLGIVSSKVLKCSFTRKLGYIPDLKKKRFVRVVILDKNNSWEHSWVHWMESCYCSCSKQWNCCIHTCRHLKTIFEQWRQHVRTIELFLGLHKWRRNRYWGKRKLFYIVSRRHNFNSPVHILQTGWLKSVTWAKIKKQPYTPLHFYWPAASWVCEGVWSQQRLVESWSEEAP